MNTHPILFSTEMVKAIEAGRKTMTRRVNGLHEINENPNQWKYLGLAIDLNNKLKLHAHFDNVHYPMNPRFIKLPYGRKGDVLWVRETFYAFGHWTLITDNETGKKKWHFHDLTIETSHKYLYEDCIPEKVLSRKKGGLGYYKRPSIHMPKAAARIFLEITNVRVERLQDISEKDAKAEGVETYKYSRTGGIIYKNYNGESNFEYTPKESFCSLWHSINGEESWNANPWVWVVEFKRVSKPENF